jgi:hypothetical protein
MVLGTGFCNLHRHTCEDLSRVLVEVDVVLAWHRHDLQRAHVWYLTDKSITQTPLAVQPQVIWCTVYSLDRLHSNSDIRTRRVHQLEQSQLLCLIFRI